MRHYLAVIIMAALLLTGCSSTPRQTNVSDSGSVSAEKTSFNVMDEMMFEKVSSEYKSAGLTLDKSSFDLLSKDVCTDMRNRGAGYFTRGDISSLGTLKQRTLARAAWLVFASSCYPDDYRLSDSDMDAIAEFEASLVSEYTQRLEAAGLSSPTPASSLGFTDTGSSSGGYTTRCSDGSSSQSGGKKGACSWHGGVSK
jgi:hypothetical protein